MTTSPAQRKALAAIEVDGAIHAYGVHGVTRPTVDALEIAGLVVVTRWVKTFTTAGGRTVAQLEWTATKA